jgi:hypothetical protein
MFMEHGGISYSRLDPTDVVRRLDQQGITAVSLFTHNCAGVRSLAVIANAVVVARGRSLVGRHAIVGARGRVFAQIGLALPIEVARQTVRAGRL